MLFWQKKQDSMEWETDFEHSSFEKSISGLVISPFVEISDCGCSMPYTVSFSTIQVPFFGWIPYRCGLKHHFCGLHPFCFRAICQSFLLQARFLLLNVLIYQLMIIGTLWQFDNAMETHHFSRDNPLFRLGHGFKFASSVNVYRGYQLMINNQFMFQSTNQLCILWV